MPKACRCRPRRARAWNYHDGNTVILGHVIRQASGGSASEMMRFARQELFDPLGMRNVTHRIRRVRQCGRIEARCWQARATGRASASSISMTAWPAASASCRRLGEIFGDADAERLGRRMGAGFWTNLGDSFGATYRTERGWPRDAFFAKGHDRAICDHRASRNDWSSCGSAVRRTGRRKPMACRLGAMSCGDGSKGRWRRN